MAHIHHLSIFSFVAVLLLPILIPATFAEGDDSWTLSEAGAFKVTRSSEEIELEKVCWCLSAEKYSEACPKLLNYGPIIRNGTCFGNLRNRSKISPLRKRDTTFSSPPVFIENVKCRGTKTIILSSSGTEKILTLTTQASVFICPGSIDTSLQQLKVISVSKIIIAPGALKPRNSNIAIRFENVQEEILIPEEAFTVEIAVPRSPVQSDLYESEGTLSLPPEVSLHISTAAKVEFRSRSIVAPMVTLKLTHIRNVVFGPRAIIPYAHPEASTLEISHCVSVIMSNQTINAGKFQAKYIKKLLMKERAVEVVDDDGAGAKIEHVSSMTILDEALSIGSGADIIFDNVTLTSAGVRSIQGIGPSNLRRATFTHVKGKQLASVAMCIKTETAVVFNLEITGKDENHIGACIEGQEIHGDIGSVSVVCEKLTVTKHLCDDPRCAPCTPSIAGHSVITPVSSLTTINSAILLSQSNDILTDTKTTLTASPLNATRSTTDDSDPSILQRLEDIPVYIIVIFLCVAVITILFIIFMIYKCCTLNKHDTYYLPQELRLSTFRNPRTIMTPENLTEQNSMPKVNDEDTPEVYPVYNSYRQHPTATYMVRSQSYPSGDSRCSAQNQLSYHEDLTPPYHYSSATNEWNRNVAPPEYQHAAFSSKVQLPREQQQMLSAEDSCLHIEDELPIDSHKAYATNLPITENQLPPPEGFVQSSDEQMPTTSSSSSSGDELSHPENSLHSLDYQLSHAEDGQSNIPTQDCNPYPANPLSQEVDQVPIRNEVPIRDEVPIRHEVPAPDEVPAPEEVPICTSFQEVPVHVNTLSLLREISDDDDELII